MGRQTDFVFLHGGGQGSWVWSETVAALSAQTGGAFGRALALDVPGCGTKRGRATDGLGPDAIADELVGDIEAAGFRDVVLVGHSQAGSILPLLLGKKPGLYRRAVFVSCVVPLHGETVIESAAQGWQGNDFGDMTPESLPARYRFMFCNDMPEDQAQAFVAKLGQDNWPALSYEAKDWRYDDLGRFPCAYFLCLRDQALPLPRQEIYAERLGVGRVVRFDAGHQVMNTRPHGFAEALRLEAALH